MNYATLNIYDIDDKLIYYDIEKSDHPIVCLAVSGFEK